MLIIRIYVKDNNIILELNTPWFKRRPYQDPRNPRDTQKTILQIMLENFVYLDKDLDSEKATKAVNRQDIPDIKTCVVYDAESRYDTSYESSLVNYTLPIDSSAAMDLIASLDIYVQLRDFRQVVVVEQDLQKYMMENLEDVKFSDPRFEGEWTIQRVKGYFVDLLKNGINVTETKPLSKVIIESILKLQACPPEYKHTLNVLRAIAHYGSLDAERNFSLCLSSMPHRLSGLIGAPEPVLLNQTKSCTDRMKFLYNLQRQLISSGRKSELNHAFTNLVHHAKLRLIEPAMGKTSFDGEAYNADFCEIQFMLTAKYYIRSDQRVGIKVVVDNNPLHVDALLATSFASKLAFLLPILGLECDKDKTDFNVEIVFTKSCSKDLVNKGLHYNLEYLRKLLRVKNDAAVLRQVPTLFNPLATVTTNIIIPLISDKEIDADEFNAFKEIGWSGEFKDMPLAKM